jgi:hypothetical protein
MTKKPMIEQCKNLNIYDDIAPFKETAYVIPTNSNKNMG